jgi:glycine/D-amino acid oxidase-like deaminating enzyme
MNLSYWEKKSWFSNTDFCVVGSGIVGLNCALHLRQKHPKAKILIIEKGTLPMGASTRNAGFACFGSISEILDDLKHLSDSQLYSLVSQRIEGLDLLIKTLGKPKIGFKQNGGYELFFDKDQNLYEDCIQNLDKVNRLLHPIFKSDIYVLKNHPFNFKGISKASIYNGFEAQIDTGKMMVNLLKKVHKSDILILNATEIRSFVQNNDKVKIELSNFDFDVKHLFIATNAFAKELLDLDLRPVRNQVVLTSPIENLKIKGTFHLDRGYFYFRNVSNRILLGGGRNMAIEEETTSRFGITNKIQSHLIDLLENRILPDTKFNIDMKWSGILGMGSVKEPILKSVSNGVHCGVRLGGMGVAIGSTVGKQLASLID